MSLVLALALATSGPAHAFCGAYASAAGTDIYNSVSEVAIVRQAGRTTLTVANDVEGTGGADFAMLVPVPEILTEDDVHVLAPDTFDVLDGYTRPRMVTYTCDDFEPSWEDPCAREPLFGPRASNDVLAMEDGAADVSESAPNVDVEAEFVVGEYEVVILSAEESDDLFTWLHDEGFRVSAATGDQVQAYLDGGAYFFAAKVSADAAIEDGDLLSPLQFSYASDVFSLPIRIGTAASKGEQDLIIYAVTDYADGAVGISNYPEMSIEDECMLDGGSFEADHGSDIGAYYQDAFTDAYQAEPGADWMLEYSWGNGHCDPCTGEQPDEQKLANVGFDFDQMQAGYMITRLHMRYSPAEATEDLVLYLSGRTEQEQMRFIEPNERLEWKFPVCGIGMVSDPGTCDFESPYDPECGDDEACGGCAATDAAHRLGGFAVLGLLALGWRVRRADGAGAGQGATRPRPG